MKEYKIGYWYVTVNEAARHVSADFSKSSEREVAESFAKSICEHPVVRGNAFHKWGLHKIRYWVPPLCQ